MSLEPVQVSQQESVPLGSLIEEINDHLRYLARDLYSEYEPTRGTHPDFWVRLENWLNNLKDEGQKQVLFRLIPHLFFIGPREFESLYRSAFNHQIAMWLVDQAGVKLDNAKAQTRIAETLEKTWFCPITDSMRINGFYHLNGIEGREYRPDWRSLSRFGDRRKISEYIEKDCIERIVLLEDFVGYGGQIEKAVIFAAELVPKLPILVVPLVICPNADKLIGTLEGKYPHLKFSPSLRLPESEFVVEKAQTNEKPIFSEIRQIALSISDSMKEGLSEYELKQAEKYIPFGWHKTGALVVLYSNCPNNTLPIIFHGCKKWEPLFPRTSRS